MSDNLAGRAGDKNQHRHNRNPWFDGQSVAGHASNPVVGCPFLITMPTTTPEVGEWVKLVGDNGAMIVITAVAIMLTVWAVVFIVLKLFGKNGIVPWVVDKFMGDEGYVSRVVSEHNRLVQSVGETNAATKEMVKSALAISETSLARQRDTHEMIVGCGHDFCGALEIAASKMQVPEISKQTEAIRGRLDHHRWSS